ncbi:hypothetical protein OG474_18345 [Kribbella sp. NBC_01505]|uniref:hypothetical protein n=1 Tax=Kribbella sp. NBC_01505 TaxID=2903580 RepID=UPI003869396F
MTGAAGPGMHKLLGLIGLALLTIVLIHLLVRRLGGWKRLFGWLGREIKRTWRAFVEPIAARRRYRRRLRLLAKVLRDEESWDQAERALGAASAIGPTVAPYAVVLAGRRIGVLVAGGTVLEPPVPWSADAVDPRLWWIDRGDVPGRSPIQEMPLLTCLGTDSGGTTVVMLDLLSGPRTLSVYGAEPTARAVVQAIAAQLDVRLPVGAVEVAEGIHPYHDGLPLSDAARRLGAWFVIGAGPLPVPLPTGRRMVCLGVARGSARLLEAMPDQTLRLHGGASWLRIDPLPLARAVARSIRDVPPHDFGGGTAPDPVETDDLSDVPAPTAAVGVSAVSREATWS